MRKILYKYQQEVVNRADKSTALFWDMGLGKTITSLAIFEKFRSRGEVDRLFVICPISMINEWCEEFENQVGMKAIPYKSISKKTKNIEEYLIKEDIHCVVLNYEMVWRITNYDWVNKNTMIICDESHRFKNPTSKIGKYMKFLKVKTPYKICLTGTPQSNGYIDYFNQLFFLDKLDMSFRAFKDRYCIYDDKDFNGVAIKQLVGYKNVEEFEKYTLSKCEFLKIERVYDEVIKHNYIKIETSDAYKRVAKDKVIYYDKNGEIITDRKLIQSYLRGEDSPVVEIKTLDNVGSFRIGMRQLTNNENKISWLRDFLEDYDDRVVIFYNFNCELRSIKELLNKINRPYSIYNGEQKSFKNFKENKNGVVLCNYKSGSVGINDLVISNIFIAYSPTDNYIEWEQSKKRIDRNGQTHTPIYYYLQCGLEDRIYYSLRAGKNFDDRVFVKELSNILGGNNE